MEAKTAAAAIVEDKPAAPAKAKRKRREPRGWYITKGVKIPLDEYLKSLPEQPTRPGRTEMLRKKYPDFFEGEILDMRAVLK
ncbi:MAG: hypothetical protein LBG47_05165 [Prevotellaceae bacterium]|jgi:hypothetical protein|nr:hypothetical protein [Prevotellaceae bacterium]